MDNYQKEFIKGISRGPFAVLKNKPEKKNASDSGWIETNNNKSSIYSCAVYQAYLDMCRTTSNLSKEDRDTLLKTIADSLQKYFNGERKNTAECFDEWYYGCVENTSSTLSFGQIQKIVNMAFKYLYCCDDIQSGKHGYFTYCHMPLDSLTLNWYKREVDSKFKNEKWSNFTFETYKSIVSRIRKKQDECNLLDAEFQIWQDEKEKVERMELKKYANRVKKQNDCPIELKEHLVQINSLIK